MFLWKDLIIKSKFNGEIKLKNYFGRYSVWVGGYEQSGPLVEKLWQQAFQTKKGLSLSAQGESFIRVLVLGLGCGSIIKPLLKKYPQAHITGVEIDPVMIHLGKKYFNLDNVPNLKILCHDAIKLKLKSKFDFAISDLYNHGDGIFNIKISKFLLPTGQIIFNYLKFGKSKDDRSKFVEILKANYEIPRIISAQYNDLFVCTPKW